MKKALFIGQAPPQKTTAIPFGSTLLYKWFDTVNITQEEALRNFTFTALVSTFPGFKGSSHRPPNEEEISQERPRLIKLIQDLHPDVIVPVGILSAREVLADKDVLLHDIVGKDFAIRPFNQEFLPEIRVIPLPHPSGASTWIYQGNHKALLAKALQLLAH